MRKKGIERYLRNRIWERSHSFKKIYNSDRSNCITMSVFIILPTYLQPHPQLIYISLPALKLHSLSRGLPENQNKPDSHLLKQLPK